MAILKLGRVGKFATYHRGAFLLIAATCFVLWVAGRLLLLPEVHSDSGKQMLHRFRRQARQVRRTAWLQGRWRDMVAALFSSAAREEQRRWKREEQQARAKFQAELDASWEEVQRKVRADKGDAENQDHDADQV